VRSEAQRLKEEAEKRLSRYMKQLDHFERARREEEAPVLQAAYQKQAWVLL
jgi:translation initiation factor 3 subunit A